MKFEELIKEYEQIQFKIRRTEIKEQEIRALKGFSTSSGEKGMPITKQNSSTVENLVLKLDGILSERKSLQEKLIAIKERIYSAIDLIPNLMSRETVESKIFIPNCGWKYISSQLGFSESYCRLLYREGVQIINEKLEKTNEI